LKAARAELLIARPKPAGAYLAHALNAAESVPKKDAPGRGDPVGKALGVKDARGRALNCPVLIVTPCCFRQLWNALSAADVGVVLAALVLEVAPALLLPLLPPQPVSTTAAASAASVPRMSARRMGDRRRIVPPFM
jgi:hypothetical protein